MENRLFFLFISIEKHCVFYFVCLIEVKFNKTKGDALYTDYKNTHYIFFPFVSLALQ